MTVWDSLGRATGNLATGQVDNINKYGLIPSLMGGSVGAGGVERGIGGILGDGGGGVAGLLTGAGKAINNPFMWLAMAAVGSVGLIVILKN